MALPTSAGLDIETDPPLPDLLRGPPDAKCKALGLCGQWLPSIQIAYAASHYVALMGELAPRNAGDTRACPHHWTTVLCISARQGLEPCPSPDLGQRAGIEPACLLSHAERQTLGLLYTLAGRTALANYRVVMRTVYQCDCRQLETNPTVGSTGAPFGIAMPLRAWLYAWLHDRRHL